MPDFWIASPLSSDTLPPHEGTCPAGAERPPSLWVYGVVGWTLVILLAVEVGLEMRAAARGWGNAPGVGPPTVATVLESGPEAATLAYRSPSGAVEPLRCWIASASYAADALVRPSEAFPARAGLELDTIGIPAEVWNASRAGLRIRDNVLDLGRDGRFLRPQVAILYGMSLDVNDLSAAYLFPRKDAGTGRAPPQQDAGWAARLGERTASYALLRGRATPWLLEARIRADALPPEAEAEFAASLHAFVDAAAGVGARPILCTFASSHHRNALEQLPVSVRHFMVRYNQSLSPRGWITTLERLNGVVRHVAHERQTALADIDCAAGGHPELFRDFVHFNPEGHLLVGRVLASAVVSSQRVSGRP